MAVRYASVAEVCDEHADLIKRERRR